ncbi:hypothetical protein JOF53_004755 [Crossiella equi]|uniref:Uncharacterized protein n=1 Tax=Crossiella equi TaxID=130796 RepID=A0ABS5AH24_9PSEU|nr:hypothetical protein [Crossiella equi]MBP2475883.1 hypothetical protein [Crossiella equi]
MPADRAVRRLELQHEPDRRTHGWPQLAGQPEVAGVPEVVPHADREVAAPVGVPGRVGDHAVPVLGGERAVRPLQPGQPAQCPGGLRVVARGVQAHGRLDVVPRVELPAAVPRDRAAVQLVGEDPAGGGGQLLRGHAGFTA